MQPRTEPTFWARVPAGGWTVGVWVGPDGHTVADVTSPSGTLAYLTSSSTRQAGLSIDAGWAGCGAGPDGKRQWWALAIGHAAAGLSQVVSFGRRASGRRIERMTLPSEAPSGLWMVHDGLWIAAAIGRYTHVRLTAQSTEHIQALDLVTE
jgi:hypothetical protein